jgi:hypothetical protein
LNTSETLVQTPSLILADKPRRCGWLGLLLVLVCAIPPLFIDLAARDAGREMENVTMLSAQETWLRHRGADGVPAEKDAWLKPTGKGILRIIKGPGVVWTYMLSWWDLNPDTATVEQIIWRARFAGAVVALIMVLSVYWMGISLGSVTLGVLSACAMATMWFFQRQGRTCSYDIHLASWCTLGVAAGLWAIQPVTGLAPRWQRIAGWSLAGLAMGFGWMCKNPLAIALVMVPLVPAVIMVAGHRKANVLGVMGMLAIAAAVALPWFRWVIQFAHGEAQNQLMTEYAAERKDQTQWYYYAGILGLIMPWTLWLIAGLVLPWAKERLVERRVALIAFFYFVLLIVMFSIPNAKQQRYIIPVVPGAALLIGLVFYNHYLAVRAGKPDRGAGLLYWPQWIGMILAAPLIAFYFSDSEKMGNRLDPVLAPLHAVFSAIPATLTVKPILELPTWAGVALAVVLIVLAVVGLRFSLRNKPLHAAAMLVAYTLITTTILWPLSDGGPEPQHLFAAAALKTAPIYKGHDAYVFTPAPFDSREYADMEEYIFYSRRIMADMNPQELEERKKKPGTFIMLSRAVPENDKLLEAAGLTKVLDVQIEPKRPYRLWKYESK